MLRSHPDQAREIGVELVEADVGIFSALLDLAEDQSKGSINCAARWLP
jgi:hypothetical protein